MGAVVNSLLSPGEQVLFETRLTWIEYILPVLFFVGALAACLFFFPGSGGTRGSILLPLGLACAILFFFGLWIFMIWLKRRTTEFVVTNLRVIAKKGIVSRDIFEMRLQKIESIDLFQNIAQRMLNYGEVVLHGTGDTAKRFKDIAEPMQFKRVITNAAEKARHTA